MKRSQYGKVMGLLSALVFLAASLLTVYEGSEEPFRPGSWRVEPDGTLSFAYYESRYRFALTTRPLPQEVLRYLARGIEFALDAGIAQEISLRDLYHGHPLYRTELERSRRSVEHAVGVLLHAQEWVFYSEDTFRKRTIFVGPDGEPAVLPCDVIWRPGITVPQCSPALPEGFAVDSSGVPTIYFVVTDGIPERLLRAYARNTITVRGHKILFGQPI